MGRLMNASEPYCSKSINFTIMFTAIEPLPRERNDDMREMIINHAVMQYKPGGRGLDPFDFQLGNRGCGRKGCVENGSGGGVPETA